MNYKSALLHGLTPSKYQNFIMVAPQGSCAKVSVHNQKILKVLKVGEFKQDSLHRKVKEEVVGTLPSSK